MSKKKASAPKDSEKESPVELQEQVSTEQQSEPESETFTSQPEVKTAAQVAEEMRRASNAG